MHCEKIFQELKRNLTSAPVLILSNPSESSMVYYDDLKIGLGNVLMENGQVMAYSS